MASLPTSLEPLYSHQSLLQEVRGVETWELQGEAGHHLLKLKRGGEPAYRGEFDFLSSLDHPGLPRACAYEIQNGIELYRREFVEGRPISEFFGRWQAEAIGLWMAQALRALAALHFRGLAHGDLSGANLLVHPNRGAVIIDLEFLAPRHRAVSEIRGTPRTMAPEIFWGHPPTIPSDLYSLGCLLYALIAGSYPFGANDFEGLLQQHALETPSNPAVARPEIPPELGLVALRLLAKEPGQRFAECNDVILAINRTLKLKESTEPQPPRLKAGEHLRATQAYSHEREALRFLRQKSELGEKELATLAELLLKTGQLDELETMLPRLANSEAETLKLLLLNRRGRYAEALKQAQSHPELKDSRTLLAKATALYYTGQVEAALRELKRQPDEREDPATQRALDNFLGNLFYFERRLTEAEAAYAKSLDGARQAGAVAAEALALMNLANVQTAQGRWEAACESYERAAELHDALGLKTEKAKTDLNLAGLLRFAGHLEKSETLIEAAGRALAMAPNSQLEGYAELLRADLAKKRGDFAAARDILEANRDRLAINPSAADHGDLLISLAEIDWATGQDAEAATGLAQARELGQKHSDPLLGQRAAFLQALLDAFSDGELRSDRIYFSAEELRKSGDIEFVLDNLLRAKRRALSRDREWPEPLQIWSRHLAERTCAAMPADYRAFFRQFYRELWEVRAMHSFNSDFRLDSILEWVRELTGELELQELSAKILARLLEFSGMERGFLILKEGERLSILQSHQIRPEDFGPHGREALSWSLTRQALESGKPLITINAQHDEKIPLARSVQALDLRGVAVLPFRFRGQTLGAIYLDSHRPGEAALNDLAYLEGLADILGLAVHNATRYEKTVQDLEQVQRALEKSQEALQLKYQYKNLIGRAPATRAFLQRVDRVTEVRATVLILGESGVGKELIARAIHYNGPLKKGPFIATNCGAIPENLVESELFGHERGSFTGAMQSHAGLFEQANRGTLFLDEIGEMSLPVQAKLLRVLQDGEVRRVGGNADRKVQVRVIAATHRNLRDEVKAGRFREDLFYRLSVAEVTIAPLRERQEDIPLLADHFLEKFAQQNQSPKKSLDAKVLSALTRYGWPGNVRELENLIYNLCIFSDGSRIGPEDLRQRPDLAALLDLPPLSVTARKVSASDPLREAIDRGEINLSEAKRRFEREEIVRTLALHHGKVGEAARHLGIPRPQLSRLLSYHHLQKEAEKTLR